MENGKVDRKDELETILDGFARQANGLIPAFHAIQERFGYIPKEWLPEVARAFNLSQADVYGVLTFYHDFRLQPVGRHVVSVCRAEACQANGSAALIDRLRRKLGVDFGETTANNEVTLLPTYCFGNCACGPSMAIDGKLYGRVNAERAERLLRGMGVLE
ncbi:formate dehydrogenase subunit gamma [Methylacidimicrobium cyclopophantes]|uniref:Formate dehydrogenase subunit gamma n=1 Tax=Methylacidimicrobium cyclopophantes TaxID=1041766 RepID=A0A5E6MAM8_9BACT|nr:NAD(P)H-dependent oxidoreductase subunit E [Methylacidimicrobium cyclopophantes]VVM06455.1 formate dehydrogenase subunit gamma [Methylacidimicrobium cyclopophantes]